MRLLVGTNHDHAHPGTPRPTLVLPRINKCSNNIYKNHYNAFVINNNLIRSAHCSSNVKLFARPGEGVCHWGEHARWVDRRGRRQQRRRNQPDGVGISCWNGGGCMSAWGKDRRRRDCAWLIWKRGERDGYARFEQGCRILPVNLSWLRGMVGWGWVWWGPCDGGARGAGAACGRRNTAMVNFLIPAAAAVAAAAAAAVEDELWNYSRIQFDSAADAAVVVADDDGEMLNWPVRWRRAVDSTAGWTTAPGAVRCLQQPMMTTSRLDDCEMQRRRSRRLEI